MMKGQMAHFHIFVLISGIQWTFLQNSIFTDFLLNIIKLKVFRPIHFNFT